VADPLGDDAHRLDDLVRRSPEQAYDVDFFASTSWNYSSRSWRRALTRKPLSKNSRRPDGGSQVRS
jgi:hypothetical protein